MLIKMLIDIINKKKNIQKKKKKLKRLWNLI